MIDYEDLLHAQQLQHSGQLDYEEVEERMAYEEEMERNSQITECPIAIALRDYFGY